MRNPRFGFAFISVTLALFASVQALAAEPFYRIIDGPNPGPARAQIDRFIYGTEVLYTGDANAHPTRVDGTVWHSNLNEAKYFVGDHNPVIEQGALFKLIENNKWEEAKLMMKYTPDAFPRTESLAPLLGELKLDRGLAPGPFLEQLAQRLRERYPEGFFLKPVAGFNSVGTFPTEKSGFASIYEAYLRDVKPVVQRRLQETHGDAETVHLELKSLPNYSGRVLEDLLAHPETVIIQAKIQADIGSVLQTPDGIKPLLAEYRVHIVEGKVLQGGTQTRWEDARSVSDAAFARVETFAQSVIDRLPPAMRKMCYGMDVMRTHDGLYQVIELNPGGESGYLYPDTDLWVTQLLAARYHGGHTELLDEFERFARQPTLDAKEAALSKLLKHPELKELTQEIAPVTELLARAKNVILAEMKAHPSRTQALDALISLKKFHLEPYLTSDEIETLANLIHDPAAIATVGLSLPRLSEIFGLQDSEILFAGSEGELCLLNGLDYDDASVADALFAQLRDRLDTGTGTGTHATAGATPAQTRVLARNLVDERIVTRSELASGHAVTGELARELGTSDGALLFYSGTRSALVRGLLERIKL